MPEEQLEKVDAAAKATGLNRFTLYKLAKRGLLPHYKAGRAIRFNVKEIKHWMREQAQQAGTQER